MLHGVARGRSTTRRECTNAMQGAGSATHIGVEDVQIVARVMAPVYLSLAVMDFVCHAAMVYLALMCTGVSALTGCNEMQKRWAEGSSETMDAKTAVPSSASAAVQAKRARRVTWITLIAAMHSLQRGFFLTQGDLQEELQKQAKQNFEAPDLDTNESGAEMWSVLFRAGGPWHGGPVNTTWKSQALPATCGGKCFLLYLGAFESVLGGRGQHLVIPIADDTGDWRGAVLKRIQALDSRFLPLADSLPCFLHGKEVGPSCPINQLKDHTLRLQAFGLPGGAPKAKKTDKTQKDVDKMEKPELMPYAKDVLGVETRREGPDGKKNLWRPVADVRKDCKAEQTRVRQALPAENAGSSSSHEGIAAAEQSTAEASVDQAPAAEIISDKRKSAAGKQRKPTTKGQQSLNAWTKAAHRIPQDPLEAASETQKHALPDPPGEQVAPGSASNEAQRPTTKMASKRTSSKITIKPYWIRSKKAKASNQARKATPKAKAADRARLATPKEKAATRARKSTPKEKAATRARKATPKSKEANRKAKAADTVGKQKANAVQATKKKAAGKKKLLLSQAARAKRSEALGRSGAWKQAAQQFARHCQQPSLQYCPPAYAGLNLPTSLSMIGQMYDCFEKTPWRTCVVCWRAWYDPPATYEFEKLQLGRQERPVPWFDVKKSVILGATESKIVDQWRLNGKAPAAEAERFLAANYPEDECLRIKKQLISPEYKRTVTICTACDRHVAEDGTLLPAKDQMRLCDFVVDPVFTAVTVENYRSHHERYQGASWPGSASKVDASPVLGLDVHVFAPAVAALSDHEEMVLALVHPLVQVYTVPRTGQLAYVGHICNFRQKVTKFLTSLPVLPSEMPLVHIKPRKYKNHKPPKGLFKVDVRKLRAAFDWLKEHNPHYRHVEWKESAATAWNDGDVVAGVVRESIGDGDDAPPVTSAVFELWLTRAQEETLAGDTGYPIGRQVAELLAGDADANDEVNYWNLMRRMVAEDFDGNAWRRSFTIPQDYLSASLCARGVLKAGFPQTVAAKDILPALRAMGDHERPEHLDVLSAEIDAIMYELSQEEPETVTAGSTQDADTLDDVGLREQVVDELASVAEELGEESGEAPGSASGPIPGDVVAPNGGEDLPVGEEAPGSASGPVLDNAAATGGGESQRQGKFKYPRLDPPEVEDQPGQAIREDTPGYIAKAFPKLFPHGVGDYHGDHDGLKRSLRFEEWARYIMLWHDQRFMRHTRFRYWLLDTTLRAMVPGAQRTFFKTRSASVDYSLESLKDPARRRELVQQMSSATSGMPGSVGERRHMRQELEAMVHQLEAETADLGMNGGAGRIPSGFCTLTCAVYKWTQLHEKILQSFPSGPADNPAYREYYTKWQAEPPGSARETAMRKSFFELAVQNPGAVAWYCSLKLEMAVHLTKALLTEQLRSGEVPGLEEAKTKLQEELCKRLDVEILVEDLLDLRKFGHVDDFYASFEWSAGGMIHTHMAFWIVGAPRIDHIEVPQETSEGDYKIERLPDGVSVTPQSEAADRLAAYWDRCFTEFNLGKAMASKREETVEQSGSRTWADLSSLASATGVREGLSKAEEKAVRSPESISSTTYAHCLLNGLELNDEDNSRCWSELCEILEGCSRTAGEELRQAFTEPGSASSEDKRVQARMFFVAALAEYVNMHDNHKPYALGPPGKHQPCAKVEHEHSSMETVHCNKLYPRKLIEAGQEEVAEDPRRRELYRLWMARNCHFLNNFVPAVLLAMLSNMDFQATLSKDAVIEYMTKYMTKSGQGALIKVMEHSFSLCIEKARENKQGTGSAVLRFFNLQSIAEVKSQLECMHLIFGAPRFMCSRTFKHLYLKSEVRQPKAKDSLRKEGDVTTSVVEKSVAEHYVTRYLWEVPSEALLQRTIPITDEPLWRFILRSVGAPRSASDTLATSLELVTQHWPTFLEHLSWWEKTRCFNRHGKSVTPKPQPDVVVVSPVGRFAQAKSDAQWQDACFWSLLAYCNHGETCKTFRDVDHLRSFDTEKIVEFIWDHYNNYSFRIFFGKPGKHETPTKN